MNRTEDACTSERSLILYACFFFSGMAGLIYEILWSKYLALYVGSTGLAQIIVLGTFMGGIAAGSQFFGRIADRAPSPLKVYALLEAGIGAYALLFEPIYSIGRSLFISLVRMGGVESGGVLEPSAWALVTGKILGSALTILLPTFLMGGTLPVLGRHMIRTMRAVGPKIARLYFLNSFGAVFGCLIAGFYLIQAYGLNFSMVTGGALNIFVGITAFLLAKREEVEIHEHPTSVVEPEDAGADEPLSKAGAWLVLGAVAVSGAVSMMYEVAWIRLLALVLGSSTYSFSLMLATFILGLSLGGLILSFRRKPSGYLAIFGLCSVGVGLSVLGFLPFYVRLPFFFNQIASMLSRDQHTFSIYQFFQFFLCAVVMIVPTILQGITLPAATKVVTRHLDTLGRRVGAIFAINTVGTLFGVFFAGFIGLPGLGIKGTLELAVFLNVALGLGVLWLARGRPHFRWAFPAAAAAALMVGLWYAAGMGPWDKEVFSAGVYRTRNRIPSFEQLLRKARERKTVFYRDGVDATVAVQDQTTPHPQRMLVINGKVDASTVGDLPTQKGIAHLPLLIHPKAENVLVVGVGSGATVGTVLAYDVKQVDVVELSRDVIDASRYFDSVNGRYWEDPRVHVHWEDAKTFLQIADRKYDVIISEPTNPWIAGIAGVFSREYYETCRDHLRPGGLFVQWVQTYELEDATFFMMLETFRSVFPCYTLWNPAGPDVALIGSRDPYKPDFARMEAAMAKPKVREDLNSIGVETLLGLLATQIADESAGKSDARWSDPDVIHSDFYPILEYIAPRGFFVGTTATGVRWIDQRVQAPANARLWIVDFMKQAKLTDRDLASTQKQMHRNGSLHREILPLAWAREWLTKAPGDLHAKAAVGQETGFIDRSIWKRMPGEDSKNETDRLLSKIRSVQLRYADYERNRSFLGSAEAPALLETIAALQKQNPQAGTPDVFAIRGELEYDLGRYADAARSLGAAARGYKELKEPEPLIASGITLCRALLAQGDANSAAVAYREFLEPHLWNLKVRLTREQVLAALRSASRPPAH